MEVGGGGFGRGEARGFDRDPSAVPDMVKQFVQYFYRHIRERNLKEVYSMYRHSWAKLSERYFQSSPWPHVDLIAEYAGNDHVFCLLYKEMYFRHLYAISQPSLGARVESWENYCQLFGVILGGNVNMQLPNEWLWEMVDEFVYQCQSFCQYRAKLTQRLPEEVAALKSYMQVWDPEQALSLLTALVDKSNIRSKLGAEGGATRLSESDGFETGVSNVLTVLGYFALVGLAAMHTLLGQYKEALKAIAPLNPFERKGLLTAKVTMANITYFYYTAFAYLMMGRYIDAARLYNYILGYIVRVKQLHQGQRVYDIILKKNEQMYKLLAITVVQAPATNKVLEENVANALREKCGDAMAKMMRADVSTYDETFSYACPKFVTGELPEYDSPPVDTNQNTYRQQLKAFLAHVESQRELPTLKQYLRLYSSISLAKLSGLMGVDVDTLLKQLRLLDSLSTCVTWSKGGPLEGSPQPCSDIEFQLELDPASGEQQVVVAEAKAQRKQVDFLVRHIIKFDEIVRDLQVIS